MDRSVPAIVACVCALILAIDGATGQEHGDEHRHAHEFGKVSFPVSCTPEAQQRFDAAASLYYSFYWEKIDAAVAAVLDADPQCAMAYWLKAQASLENALGAPPTAALERQGWAAVEKARQLEARTPRERDYIAAIEVVFRDRDTVAFPARAIAYEKALERLHARYPDDSEATVLYAFWLQVTADRNDQTYANQLKSAKLLEPVFAAQPHHPGAAHFLIHAYDFPTIAVQGLDAARRYASIAPDSPHALHMPSHIFSRVGQWQDSIDTNARSRAAASQDRDAYHALDYMVYAALQLARDSQVREWVEFVGKAPTPDEEARQIAYAAAAIPARFALERGDWAAAARLSLHPTPADFNWSAFPEAEAVNAYARGLGAARRGDARAADAERARLTSLRAAMVAQRKDYWIEQANVQMDVITAWIARAEGHADEAVRLLRVAADREDRTEEHIMMPGRLIPAREMLGELLLDLDRPELALAEFERSQQADPNRFRNVYGAARAAERSGDRARAKLYYRQLLQQVDPQAARSEIRHAAAFLRNR
ncbi:MAG TPA: hypothetical protein PKE27_17535 [Povalibacter sp.]|uniref:tetratricopeptide repeat protein n=1 Tax=Povalibacter sp. TaxID=1962978 RepID=UPI002B9CF2EA|nr:hypothetical protein [Povalibacter sp.]HMN46385.1 hypothetical protein [Povalibacter sp.]